MSFITSPNMNLTIPTVGNESGPQYATDVNNCLNTIDQHNHTPGLGVQITPGGLNINGDLPINGNNLTLINTTRFNSLTGTLPSSSPNIGCLYVSGNELYYNDYSGGHVVQLTTNGSVNSGAGSITGLPSGTASVTYTSSTYVFQSATTVPAVVDIGSVIIRNTTASANGVTLLAPSALGASYSLTLPAQPAQTNVMTLTSGGVIGSTTWDQVGENMTSVGANAIGASMTSTGANDVGVSMTATGANAIGSSMTATGADAVAASMDSTGVTSIAATIYNNELSTAANDITKTSTNTLLSHTGSAGGAYLWGVVNTTGTVITGVGFTANWGSTGICSISFNTNFGVSETPCVVVTLIAGAGYGACVTGATKTGCTVECYGTDGTFTLTTLPFCIMVIG